MKVPAAIIGASGYTGAELIRLLHYHPNVEIKALAAESNAGKPIGEIYPHLAYSNFPDLISLNEVRWDEVEVVFCCLPHGTAQEIIYQLPRSLRVIDLSADYRLFDPQIYEKWYGKPHFAPQLQNEAVYGLTEIFRAAIAKSRLVACPGCYPTSALLPLIPLVESGKISLDGIIIDSKSGVTGAGRSVRVQNLFTEVNEGVRAYGIGAHRHMPEIEQALSASSGGTKVQVTFTPQIVPMSRGILSTIYVKMIPGTKPEELQELLTIRYENDQFIQIMPEGKAPSTRDVAGSNSCFMSVFGLPVEGRAVIISVIDNLIKGASGQAVQNFNLLFGFPEDTGLKHIPVFP